MIIKIFWIQCAIYPQNSPPSFRFAPVGQKKQEFKPIILMNKRIKNVNFDELLIKPQNKMNHIRVILCELVPNKRTTKAETLEQNQDFHNSFQISIFIKKFRNVMEVIKCLISAERTKKKICLLSAKTSSF